jgi:Cys-tRNA synthase (O-phospho-L-seryl-tRNA:Cys-tRNA synthase)
MGSSTLHNNKLLEFAEAIKKRKTYTTIRPVIATGDTIQFGSAVSFQNAKDWLDGKMVCGNCGHANDIMACKHPEIRSFLQNNTEVDFLVTSDFGCNNWEAK